MKRNRVAGIVAAVVLIGAVFAFVGCAKGSSQDDRYILTVAVEEIWEDSLLVEISEEYEEAKLYGTLRIPNWFRGEVEIGDVIVIRHNGKFLKTSPATIAEILEMRMTDAAGYDIIRYQ